MVFGGTMLDALERVAGANIRTSFRPTDLARGITGSPVSQLDLSGGNLFRAAIDDCDWSGPRL